MEGLAYLHTKDAPYRCVCFLEDRGAVVKVSFDDGYVGLGGKGFGAGGGGVAGQGEDFEGWGGLGGEEGFDGGTALFAGGAGYENCFGSHGLLLWDAVLN